MSTINKIKLERSVGRKAIPRPPRSVQMQGEAPRVPALPQQAGQETTGRAAGDWPPNTWWP